MNDDYITRLGYGYKVPFKKVYELNNQQHEAFINSHWTIIVNGVEEADYFFGILQGFIKPGYIVEVPSRRNYSNEELNRMITEYKTYFPNEKDYICRDWILSCIN